jgi:hypothetical protein
MEVWIIAIVVILCVLVLSGIIVGVLFATGVIGSTSNEKEYVTPTLIPSGDLTTPVYTYPYPYPENDLLPEPNFVFQKTIDVDTNQFTMKWHMAGVNDYDNAGAVGGFYVNNEGTIEFNRPDSLITIDNSGSNAQWDPVAYERVVETDYYQMGISQVHFTTKTVVLGFTGIDVNNSKLRTDFYYTNKALGANFLFLDTFDSELASSSFSRGQSFFMYLEGTLLYVYGTKVNNQIAVEVLQINIDTLKVSHYRTYYIPNTDQAYLWYFIGTGNSFYLFYSNYSQTLSRYAAPKSIMEYVWDGTSDFVFSSYVVNNWDSTIVAPPPVQSLESFCYMTTDLVPNTIAATYNNNVAIFKKDSTSKTWSLLQVLETSTIDSSFTTNGYQGPFNLSQDGTLLAVQCKHNSNTYIVMYLFYRYDPTTQLFLTVPAKIQNVEIKCAGNYQCNLGKCCNYFAINSLSLTRELRTCQYITGGPNTNFAIYNWDFQ